MTTEQRPPDTSITATKMVIGGELVDAADGQTFQVSNPARGVVMATAPQGGKEDVDRAVKAATAAFEDPQGWSSWSAAKRGRTLMKLSNLVKEHLEELAQLESRNGGKPISRARGGGPRAGPGLAGVVGLLVPWTLPMPGASWKLGPALAAGNTCILKPASYTPLTAIRLGELALEAGFPPGGGNIVTGRG